MSEKKMVELSQDQRDMLYVASSWIVWDRCKKCNRLTPRDYICQHCGSPD